MPDDFESFRFGEITKAYETKEFMEEGFAEMAASETEALEAEQDEVDEALAELEEEVAQEESDQDQEEEVDPELQSLLDDLGRGSTADEEVEATIEAAEERPEMTVQRPPPIDLDQTISEAQLERSRELVRDSDVLLSMEMERGLDAQEVGSRYARASDFANFRPDSSASSSMSREEAEARMNVKARAAKELVDRTARAIKIKVELKNGRKGVITIMPRTVNADEETFYLNGRVIEVLEIESRSEKKGRKLDL